MGAIKPVIDRMKAAAGGYVSRSKQFAERLNVPVMSSLLYSQAKRSARLPSVNATKLGRRALGPVLYRGGNHLLVAFVVCRVSPQGLPEQETPDIELARGGESGPSIAY